MGSLRDDTNHDDGARAAAPRAHRAESELHYYWKVLYGRRWIVLGCALLGLALTAVYTLRQPRLYEAQATVEFKQALPPGKDVEIDKHEIFIPPALAARLLTTKLLAARVIRDQRRDGNPWFDPPAGMATAASGGGFAALLSGVSTRLRAALGGPSPPPTAKTATELDGVDLVTIRRYYGHVEVKPVPMTSLADIVVRHTDPVIAARIANAHAETFLEMDVESKAASLTDAGSLFRQQLEEMKAKLEESREKLGAFQREHGILILPKDQTTITRESLQQLNQLLTEAQGERIVAEANDRNARELPPEELARTLPDASLQALRGELLAQRTRYAALLHDYGPNHPDMVAMRAQVDSLEGRLVAAAIQARENLRAVYEVARSKERELRANFEELSRAASEEDRQHVELLLLQREVDANQQLYADLLHQTKEADLISGAFRWTNVNLVDRAVPPSLPSYPETGRNLQVGFLAGLLIGIAGCVLLDRLDTRLYTPDQVTERLRLPTYGVVPDFQRLAGARTYGAKLLPPRQLAPSDQVVTALDPASVVSEAYRGIRTNLLFSSPEEPPKTVLITSSQPGEGKTVTAINVAVSLALSGSRVLVVDADLRKPGCHRALQIPGKPGLSDVLAGQCELAAAVFRSPLVAGGEGAPGNGHGLYVLPAGSAAPNPAELLGSAFMTNLLSRLREDFDFILIDSPPILPVTDSVVIATKADGVLMVVKSGAWGFDVTERGLVQLESVRANVLGVVLNRVDVHRSGSSYYYYRHDHGTYYGTTSRDGAPGI